MTRSFSQEQYQNGNKEQNSPHLTPQARQHGLSQCDGISGTHPFLPALQPLSTMVGWNRLYREWEGGKGFPHLPTGWGQTGFVAGILLICFFLFCLHGKLPLP